MNRVDEVWSKFSMEPHTEEELEARMLENIDSLCVSYVCRFSKLSEKFIERMLALTTGVLNPSSSEDDIQRLVDFMVTKLTDKSKSKEYKNITLNTMLNVDKDVYLEKPVKFQKDVLNDRVDWVYIARYQELSNEFIMKYADYLDCRDLSANENVDLEFINSYAPNLKGYCLRFADKVTETSKD